MSSVLNDKATYAKIIRKKTRVKADYMYVLGVLSTFIILFNFKLGGVALSKFIMLGFSIYICWRNRGRLRKSVYKLEYIPYFLITIVSVLLILGGDSPYKEYSVRSLVDFLFILILCLTVATCNNEKIRSFFIGVRVSCYVQIIWCFLQIVFWYILHIDINKMLFVDGFHLIENASKYNSDGVLCISGLSHHPSNLIVVIIFTLFLVNKAWKWPVCIAIAIASRNSTTLIAIVFCMILYLIPSIRNFFKKKKFNRKGLLFLLITLAVLVAFTFMGGNVIVTRISEILLRIQSAYNGTAYDGSTIAHASYYTFLPQVWEKFSLAEKLFGYSYGWTGGMFSYFFGAQYSLIFTRPSLNWGVESDPMNLIYGIGIIGAVTFYWWLSRTAIKGIKINNQYFIMIVSLIIAGIFYCIQYSMVIVIEVLLTVAVFRKMDVFIE